MTVVAAWLRRQLAGVVALVLMIAVFLVGRPTFASQADREQLAGAYGFAP